MDEEVRLKQRIIEAVSSFQRTQLAVTCESITVDSHPDALVVTLRGATCPAEGDYAQDRGAQRLLERLHGELFDVIKPLLETKIQEILGRQVQTSKLSIDAESGTGVILLTLKKDARSMEQRDARQGIEAPNTER